MSVVTAWVNERVAQHNGFEFRVWERDDGTRVAVLDEVTDTLVYGVMSLATHVTREEARAHVRAEGYGIRA